MQKSSILLMSLLTIFFSSSRGQTEGSGFHEPSNPKQPDQALWKKVGTGFHTAFGSINARYEKHLPPSHPTSPNWKGAAWKGERKNIQMVLWSSESVTQIKITATGFKSAQGEEIPKENIDIHPVRYVLTDQFLSGCGRRDKDTIPSSLAADILETNQKFNLQSQTLRPVWIKIDVPVHVKPGTYEGEIIIDRDNGDAKKLSMKLTVQDFTLPPAREWSFHLDLWQNPFSVARIHEKELWSDEHLNALSPYLKMLAQAGQKSITTSILHRPWGGQTYDHFESMIKWTHLGNNKWTYDYSIFDKWVELAMEAGIDEQINCYSLVPWGNQVRYYDAPSEEYVTVEVKPGSNKYKAIWKPFLTQFRDHLKEKGWLHMTNIAMDERALKDMKNTIDFIQKVTPDLNIALAGNYHKEISDDLKDLCVFHVPELERERIKERKEKGLITTFYTSCAPPEHPNNFTFSSPAEQTLLGWYAAARGYDGFLRWAYNSWVKDPLMDSRFITWPAGDTYQIYPGPRSSIRFEKLREGIQDFEKIRIIGEKLKEKDDQEGLEKLNSVLSAFSHQKITTPGSAATLVKNAKKQLNEIIVEHLQYE